MDEQTTLITLLRDLHAIHGLNHLFLGLKYCKNNIKPHPFCIRFLFSPSCGDIDTHGLRRAVFL